MKRKFIFLFALLSMVLAIAFTSCKKNNDANPDQDTDDQQVDTSDNAVNDDTIIDVLTVYDVIVQADSFDYLVNAIQEAGLVETLKQQSADYTIFVPTQAAINVFVSEKEEYQTYADIPNELWM